MLIATDSLNFGYYGRGSDDRIRERGKRALTSCVERTAGPTQASVPLRVYRCEGGSLGSVCHDQDGGACGKANLCVRSQGVCVLT